MQWLRWNAGHKGARIAACALQWETKGHNLAGVTGLCRSLNEPRLGRPSNSGLLSASTQAAQAKFMIVRERLGNA